LKEWGFEVVFVDVFEFYKGGGLICCLINLFDVCIGCDLLLVLGGEVLLP